MGTKQQLQILHVQLLYVAQHHQGENALLTHSCYILQARSWWWFHFHRESRQWTLPLFTSCMNLQSQPFFFIQRHTEKNEKWDNLTRKTWDSCWNQTPDWLCVYTASLEFSSLYVSVTRSPSSLPVSVPMTPLLPRDRDPSLIWAKLHSLTADLETDSDETTAGSSLWSTTGVRKLMNSAL